MTQQALSKDVVAYIQAIRAVADAIRELGEVPSGHLYAQLCGVMTLGAYETMLSHLEGAGLIKIAPSHLITWIGEANA